MKKPEPIQKKPKAVSLSRRFTNFRRKLSPRRRKIFAHDSPQDRFTAIFTNNFWRNDESISGCGSTVEYTENLRAELPKLFDEYGIKSILDAPCGDYNWMQMVVDETGVKYTGGDIVAPLIDQNQQNYGRDGVKFIQCDITKGPLPKSDIMMVRDCLFHLSYQDILGFLEIFSKSEIPLLLTSSHLNKNAEFSNEDIQSAGFRNIDLFSYPFEFTANNPTVIADDPAEICNRHMYLFTKEQIAKAAKTLAANLA